MGTPDVPGTPAEMWWSPTLAAQPHMHPGFIVRDDDGHLLDGRGFGIVVELPADAVRLVPDTTTHAARVLATGVARIEQSAWRRGYEEARAELAAEDTSRRDDNNCEENE